MCVRKTQTCVDSLEYYFSLNSHDPPWKSSYEKEISTLSLNELEHKINI